MPIVKVKKYKDPYVQIDKRVIEDTRLSWKAKGMLVYLLSKPDNWQVRVKDLVKKAKDGREAALSGIAELIENGYAIREQSHTEAGKWAVTVYTITEQPQTGFPVTVKPVTDNPLHSNKDSSDIDSSDNKPIASRKPRAPRTPTPPAVKVFQANAHRYPAKGWYAKVDAAIGDDPAALQKWGAIVLEWVGKGRNPVNVAGMLEVYKDGWQHRGNGSAKKSNVEQSLENIADWAARDGA